MSPEINCFINKGIKSALGLGRWGVKYSLGESWRNCEFLLRISCFKTAIQYLIARVLWLSLTHHACIYLLSILRIIEVGVIIRRTAISASIEGLVEYGVIVVESQGNRRSLQIRAFTICTAAEIIINILIMSRQPLT